MSQRPTPCPLRHPDTVRELLYGLHMAGNVHRHVGECIDAMPIEGREAAKGLYLMRIEAVSKAIDDLQAMQDFLRNTSKSHEDAAINAAIATELQRANITTE